MMFNTGSLGNTMTIQPYPFVVDPSVSPANGSCGNALYPGSGYCMPLGPGGYMDTKPYTPPQVMPLTPGDTGVPTDVAVPLSTIQQVIAASGTPAQAGVPQIQTALAPSTSVSTFGSSVNWAMWIAVAALGGLLFWQSRSGR